MTIPQSTAFFNDLPVVNQRSLILPEVHLQSRAFRRIHEGLDGRFDDATARQFYLYMVADFVVGHGCRILRQNDNR